jgi:hypothetical protein
VGTAPGTAGPRDCPECRSAGSVSNGVCQLCFAEPAETAAVAGRPAVRFADVIAELEAVAWLARDEAGGQVAEACRRARRLLLALKEQFVEQVVLAPAGRSPVPELEAPVDPDPAPLSA